MQPENQPAPAAPAAPAPQAPEPAPAPAAPEPGVSLAPPTPPPADPNPAPQPAPVGDPQPAPTPAAPAPAEPQYKSYEDYLESFEVKADNLPELPTPGAVPKDDDGTELAKFFQDFAASIEQRTLAQAEAQRTSQERLQSTEKQLWDEAIGKYEQLKEPRLRDLVHSVRVGYFNRGEAITPSQAAEVLIGELNRNYQNGVSDQNTQVTIQASQPLNGGGNPPAQPAVNQNSLTAIQQPGQLGMDAAIAMIQTAIDNNEL